MEIFIRNLDSKTTRDELKLSLEPILQSFQIHCFDVRKATSKTFASLTIADNGKAYSFLAHAQTNPRALRTPSGRQAQFQISRNAVDAQALRVLQKEEKDRQSPNAWQQAAKDAERHGSLNITALRCGRWESTKGSMLFVPYFEARKHGRLLRRGNTLIVSMETTTGSTHELIMNLNSVYSMAISERKSSSRLTVSLIVAPKIFHDRESIFSESVRYRESTFLGLAAPVIACCLAYDLSLPYGLPGLKKRVESLTSHRIPVTLVPPTSYSAGQGDFEEQISILNNSLHPFSDSFRLKFQMHALWVNGSFSPGEVRELIPVMLDVRAQAGADALIEAIKRLNSQSPLADATSGLQQTGVAAVSSAITRFAQMLQPGEEQNDSADEVSIHRITVTPLGAYFYGPEVIATNRVIRQYRTHSDCFLRVLFADEDGDRIVFDRSYSNEQVFKGRFLHVLRNGLDVAGKHFDFLGFSHSSLRSQTCWFMCPFKDNEVLLSAKSLIAKLGDFSIIRCPAKCAARIGQTFSDTQSAAQIDESIVIGVDDVKTGRYVFTDGCGTMSRSIWSLLRGNSSARDQPTSYQIRYKGAKGMLTLDNRLQGDQIRLRKSMIKFTGSSSNEIEICGQNSRPLPFKLNRQIIKILEDLDVPAVTFEKLQQQAVDQLRKSATSAGFIDFFAQQLTDTSSGLPRLLKCLRRVGIDVVEDHFLRDVLGALIQIQLREIKYRSRIPVPDAVTLFGISDETGWLKEGQVFVTFDSGRRESRICLQGTVAVTRSPALHPGDIQTAQAVSPPEGSSLRALRNCVVFSQKGARDLPSMLSGGDLDGDLYNIIYDRGLMPRKTCSPAAYTPAKPVDIGRSVTTDDITGFFIDFMENDQLGRIATLHQVIADTEGTMSSTCILLAELHSTAVDFSKSGVPVDLKKIPRSRPYRPDFMAPSASTKVEKGIKRSVDLELLEGGQPFSYYESDKILGQLYRLVDENLFFQNLEDDTSSLFSAQSSDTVLEEVLMWVTSRIGQNRIENYIRIAGEVKTHYESNIMDIMSTYGVARAQYLTEKEVLIGTIMGRSGPGNRAQREQSEYMTRRFNKDLRDIKSWMQTKTAEDVDGMLRLAAACLYVAVKSKEISRVQLYSFGWFAAGLCVPELVEREETTNEY